MKLKRWQEEKYKCIERKREAMKPRDLREREGEIE